MKLSFYLLIPFLFFYLQASSQTIISGKIVDEKSEILNGATIIISKDTTSSILAYGISDQNGSFNIMVNSEVDSLSFKVSYIGFETFIKTIPNKKQELQINLFPSSESLKEVIVKAEIIAQRGDTLSYSVSAFKGTEDRVIADVLKKMPGIEIMPDGQILYEGKPIQKYYIEGLDLLEGQYNLANENISAEAVSKVQILEKHQPIKVLDSLVFSERASLNIRLKNDVTVSGTAEIASGFSPLLRKINATPMIFTKKRQAIITYQSNNIGEDLSKEIKDFSFDLTKKGFNNNQHKWLSISEISHPPFSETRWLDNNAHLGSINYLTKFGKEYQFKTNIFYLNDTQEQIGEKVTKFFTPNGSIDLIENTKNKLYINKLFGKITLEKNTESNYLKNQIEFKGIWDSQKGALLLNETLVDQKVKSPFNSVQNKFSLLQPLGNQLLNIKSNIGYNENTQELKVTPGQFDEILNNNEPYPEIGQMLLEKDIFMDNSVGFTKARGQFTFTPEIGLALQKKDLNSNLYKEGILLDEINFKNSLKYINADAYLYNSLSFESKDEIWNLRFTTPFTFKNIVVSTSKNNEGNLHKFIFEPNVYARKKLSAFWETNISAGLNFDFGDIQNLYPNYILINYRNLQSYDAPISETLKQHYSWALRFRNPLIKLFLQSTYAFNFEKNNLLYSNNIQENGTIILNAIQKDNNSLSHSFSISGSKYLTKLKTTLKLKGSYIYTNREQIINNINVDLINNTLNTGVSIDSEIFSWLSINYDGEITLYRTSFSNNKYQKIINNQHLLKSFFFLKDNQYVNLEAEYYSNSISKNDNNYFLNLGYQYTFKESNIDLNVSWNNILNTDEFIKNTTSEFSYVQTSYKLRPSQILAGIKFTF